MSIIPLGEETWCMKEWRIRELEQAERDLAKAKLLIARLRAENEVLKDEKKRFIGIVDATKRHISIAGNSHKKYGVSLVKSQLMKARLL